MKNIVILYHTGCSDGFGAAWVAWKKFGNQAEYIPLRHQTRPDRHLAGKRVYLLDITFFGKDLAWLLKNAHSVTTIDHHAQALPEIKKAPTHMFRKDKSGATLAWSFFHPHERTPRMLKHIEDIDLWRLSLPKTQKIMAALDAEPMEFKAWSQFAEKLERNASAKKIIETGTALFGYQLTLAKNLARKAAEARFGGYRAGVVNSPILNSEIGYELYHTLKFPIGIIWSRRKDYYSISLRSKKINVARLAKRYGGGGHPGAAGIKLPLNAKLPWQYKKNA
jgi:hypothetical protein